MSRGNGTIGANISNVESFWKQHSTNISPVGADTVQRGNLSSRARLLHRRPRIQGHQHIVIRREVQPGGRANLLSRQALDEIVADQ